MTATLAYRSEISTSAKFWAAIGAIAAGSLLLRQDGATPDVSWLTSMCERMLSGEKGWVDIFETTPPVPTLLYMPGAWMAQIFGVNSELTVFATTYAAIFLALAFTQHLLPERIEGSGPSRFVVTLPAAVFFFILSNDAFAQREYFAAAFSLPAFAIFVRRAEGNEWPCLADRAIAAALAGLAFAIKPPLFALPFLGLAACEWTRTRSLRFLFPSFLPVAAAVGVLLTAISLVAFPAYLGGVTQLMRDVYVPVRASADEGFTTSFFATLLCAAAGALLLNKHEFPAASVYALILVVSFAAIYFAQGKYFPYHILPAALFAFIALAIAFWPCVSAAAKTGRRLIHSGIALFAAASLFIGFDDAKPQMHDLSWAKTIDHPTTMAISPVIAIGFPLAEHIHARWIDRIHSQWVAHYARIALHKPELSLAKRKLYQGYFDRDIARTREVIRDKKPEIILQCAAPGCLWLTKALLAGDPTLLDDYAPIAEEGIIRVLQRR